MSKKNIYISIVILLICVIVILGLLLFRSYYENGYFKGNPKEVVELNIPSAPVTRIGILGSNSNHFEIDKIEDIQEIINILKKIKLSYIKDTAQYENNVPGFECKITVYTLWDEELINVSIVNENVIKYNNSYYNIESGTFDLKLLENIVSK